MIEIVSCSSLAYLCSSPVHSIMTAPSIVFEAVSRTQTQHITTIVYGRLELDWNSISHIIVSRCLDCLLAAWNFHLPIATSYIPPGCILSICLLSLPYCTYYTTYYTPHIHMSTLHIPHTTYILCHTRSKVTLLGHSVYFRFLMNNWMETIIIVLRVTLTSSQIANSYYYLSDVSCQEMLRDARPPRRAPWLFTNYVLPSTIASAQPPSYTYLLACACRLYHYDKLSQFSLSIPGPCIHIK